MNRARAIGAKMSTLPVAFEDFILSREAMLCRPETIHFFQRRPLSMRAITGARSGVWHTLKTDSPPRG